MIGTRTMIAVTAQVGNRYDVFDTSEWITRSAAAVLSVPVAACYTSPNVPM
jgi:hypothetical protein